MPLHHLFDIASHYNGNLVLAVANDKPDFKIRGTAYVFDLKSKAQVRKFPVRYEFPGSRLALARDDQFGFVGCYEAYGLAAYCLKTGEEVWRRKDLKSVQGVVASEVEDWVFCGRETGAAHLLDAATGKTLEKLNGVKGIHVSPFDGSVIVARRALELHFGFGRKVASFKRVNDYELRCAFSPSEFILNEPDCLRCYDLKTQELLWSYTNPGKTQRPAVYFCQSKRTFLAMAPNDGLLIFDARTGRISREVTFATPTGWGYSFCNRGSQILAANLQLLSTENGALLDDLATAELLAWDPEARMDRFRELAASNRSAAELERYMVSEGFAENDIMRVLMMKYSNDKRKS